MGKRLCMVVQLEGWLKSFLISSKKATCGFLKLFLWCLWGLALEVNAEPTRKDSIVNDASSSTLIKAQKAADQTVDMVRWLSKRRQLTIRGIPYGFTGLPIVYFSRNTGWNYGFLVRWRDYRRQPYRYRMSVQFLRSTAGKISHSLRLKVPNISGTGFGVRAVFSIKRDIRTRYFGLGNDSQFRRALITPSHPDFIDENYYFYVLESPRFIFSLLRTLYGPVHVSVGLGVERTAVSRRGDHAFYLDAGTPDGVKDGVTGFLSATVSWDTRDDDTVPQQGGIHEWSYETSRNSILGAFFEEIDFQRYTFTDARYVPLVNRLNLSNRLIFEVLDGAVPLYAYGEIGGSRRIKGLGGNDALRGFDRQRFTDNVRFFSNTELRYYLHSMRTYKQYLEWHAVFFVDTGRVWSSTDKLTSSGMHMTTGTSVRCYWNQDTVIRFEVGVSSEQIAWGIRVRNIF